MTAPFTEDQAIVVAEDLRTRGYFPAAKSEKYATYSGEHRWGIRTFATDPGDPLWIDSIDDAARYIVSRYHREADKKQDERNNNNG